MNATEKYNALMDKGVYAIVDEQDDILYIGSTINCFFQRWKEHEECVMNWHKKEFRQQQQGCHNLYNKLFWMLSDNKQYNFKVLFSTEDIKMIHGVCTKSQIDTIIRNTETCLIQRLNPPCNVQDNTVYNAWYSYYEYYKKQHIRKLTAHKRHESAKPAGQTWVEYPTDSKEEPPWVQNRAPEKGKVKKKKPKAQNPYRKRKD